VWVSGGLIASGGPKSEILKSEEKMSEKRASYETGLVQSIGRFEYPLDALPEGRAPVSHCGIEIYIKAHWRTEKPSGLVVIAQDKHEQPCIEEYSPVIAMSLLNQRLTPTGFGELNQADILWVLRYNADAACRRTRFVQHLFKCGPVELDHWDKAGKPALILKDPEARFITPEQIEAAMGMTFHQMGISEPA
jgi:hypothetical protein